MGQAAARNVVVSMSSASPFASFAIVSALAGATMKTDAAFARETWETLNSKLRSKVSTRHLCPVRVSKVIGLIMFTALGVIITRTSAPALTSILARDAALYAAILAVTPRITVFPLSMRIL